MAEVTSIRDSASAWLNRRLPSVMEALGIRAVGMVTQELDTPYPPASKPGESPHKRTGNLQAGVSHEQHIEGNDIVQTIISRRPPAEPGESPNVPIILEEFMDRPYMRPVMNQAEQLVPQSMRQSLDSEATYAAAG